MLNRRDFIGIAGTGAGLVAARSVGAASNGQDKLSRIAIMMYGLDRLVKNNRPASPERKSNCKGCRPCSPSRAAWRTPATATI